MKDYGMFTKKGNKAVASLVECAKEWHFCWSLVESELYKLSKKKGFGEAMDTVVREAVYVEWKGSK